MAYIMEIRQGKKTYWRVLHSYRENGKHKKKYLGQYASPEEAEKARLSVAKVSIPTEPKDVGSLPQEECGNIPTKGETKPCPACKAQIPITYIRCSCGHRF